MARKPMTAEELLGGARLAILRRFVWWGRWLWRIRFKAKAGVGVCITPGLTVHYDPALVLAFADAPVDDSGRETANFVSTVLFHEMQHPLRKHPQRAQRMADNGMRVRYEAAAQKVKATCGVGSWHELANLAGDLEINDDVLAAGFKFPARLRLPGQSLSSHVTFPVPAAYGLRDGGTMEEYADQLLSAAEALLLPDPPPDKPKPGDGDGDGLDGEGEGEASEAGDGDSDQRDDDRNNDQPEGGDESDDDADGDDEGEDEEGVDADDDRDERPDERRDPDPAAPAGGDGLDGEEREQPEGTDAEPADDRGGEHGRGDDQPQGPPRPDGWCHSCEGHADPDDLAPGEVALAERQFAVAVMEAAARGEKPAGFLLDWAGKFLTPPKVNPYHVLASHLRGVASAVRGTTHRKFGPPSRRRIALVQTLGDEAPILPGRTGNEPRCVIVLDTSGSMGQRRMKRAASELYGIARKARMPLTALAVDAEVHVTRVIKTADDILALNKGGGGTDMRVGIKAATDPKLKANVICCITDGETPWPEPHDIPADKRLVLIVVNNSPRVMDGIPLFLKRRAVRVEEA